MAPRRPLRSVMLCQPRYLSGYVLGVGQAMGILGHWHREVSLWDGRESVAKQIAEMSPDVIWTHMACWPPEGSMTAEDVADVLACWRRRGAVVFLHDGDPRDRTIRVDVPSSFTMALVNRDVPSYWGVPHMTWHYGAMVQNAIPTGTWVAHDLLFAGNLRLESDDALYGDRTRIVREVSARLGPRMAIHSPGQGDVNSRMLAAEVAHQTHAVLGFGRPDVKGWIDTRVFQWAGAGGVLIHDDAGGVLEPDVHFLSFDRSKAVDSILWRVDQAKAGLWQMREAAFKHIQASHTWVHRVRQALAPFGLAS